MAKPAPLAGVRIIECSILGPGALTTHLVDLGAEVIKIESAAGDYIRRMTWPIVEGVSLMHLHINRGKRSLVLDLRTPIPQSEELYSALKLRGIPTTMLRFEGEWHGTESRPSNWMRTMLYMQSWFGRFGA